MPKFLGYGLLILAVTGLLIIALLPREQSLSSSPAPIPSMATPVPLAATQYPVPLGSIFVATTGNDTAAGTESAPLRTITAAVKKARSGDTITIRGGTYRETVGSINKRITLQPYPNEQVWAKGSLVVLDWVRDGSAWRHINWAPKLCRTCFIPGIIDAAHPLAGLPDMVFINDTSQRQVASRAEVKPGTFFVDVASNTLIIGDDPTGKTVEATVFDRFLQFDKGGANGSVLRGIGVAHYGSNQNYGVRGAMVIVDAKDVVIENSTFAWSASTGLGVYQPNVTVNGNTLVNNGLAGLSGNRADNLRMTRNTFSHNNNEQFSLSGESIGSAGAKLTRTRNLLIADNVFTDNLATGWWCDLGCIDATVIRNVAKNNTGNGLYYEVSSRALIASNLMVGNGRGLKISSSDQVRVHNNTFSENKISLGIYNDPRDPSFDKFSVDNKLSWITAETKLVNNYFAQHGDQTLIEVGDYKAHPEKNPPMVATSDANAYLADRANRTQPLFSWSTGQGKVSAVSSLAEFRKMTNQESHGIEVAPDVVPFVDPARSDYTLKPAAPGFEGGLPLTEEVIAALGPIQRVAIGVLFGPQS